MLVEMASTPTTPLSEENLRIHDAAYPKSDGFFQVNLIRDERAQVMEQERYRHIFGDAEEWEDVDLGIPNPEATLEAASRDSLRLYHGHFASSATPMNRFMTISPANDTHPWLARDAMEEAGVNYGDLETMEVRQLASELMATEEIRTHTRAGSPRPSSDTLSVSRFREMRKAKKRPRVRKSIVVRKRDTKHESLAESSQSVLDGSTRVATSDNGAER